jgi:RimJ/RimL family protein N-acetyltransferase
MSVSKISEPEGALVSTAPALSPSARTIHSNLPSSHVHSVTLAPLSQSHSKDLYSALAGDKNAQIWRYIPDGPFYDLEAFTEHVKSLIDSTTFFPFTIIKHDSETQSAQGSDVGEVKGTPMGIVCLMNIVPSNRCFEIGHVVFSPLLQRTTAATEAIYLLMKHCFEDLNYRRVEWKANNLNEPSKRAAVRLGFVPEGIFRKHMIVKGRNRDTAWFSVVDDEWAVVKGGLEGWLEKGNFDGEGKQVRKLEEIRKQVSDKMT